MFSFRLEGQGGKNIRAQFTRFLPIPAISWSKQQKELTKTLYVQRYHDGRRFSVASISVVSRNPVTDERDATVHAFRSSRVVRNRTEIALYLIRYAHIFRKISCNFS
jgi:hypothetical protein